MRQLYDDILAATELEALQKSDIESLKKLLARILDELSKPVRDLDLAPLRNRKELVLLEIQRRTTEENHKKQWDMWAADMFQRIQSHESTIKVSTKQLADQKSSSNKAMWISIAAALASIASAFLAWLAFLQKQ